MNLNIKITSHATESGVSDQPFGDAETKRGAINRARNVMQISMMDHHHCDFAVGLEGGCEKRNMEASTCNNNNNNNDTSTLWCMAWMAIVSPPQSKFVLCPDMNITTNANPYVDCSSCNKDKPTNEGAGNDSLIWGYAKTASFQLPVLVSRLVLVDGMELGDADDRVFERVNSKQGSGTVGVLTHGLVDRSGYYTHAIMLALCPWLWPSMY